MDAAFAQAVPEAWQHGDGECDECADRHPHAARESRARGRQETPRRRRKEAQEKMIKRVQIAGLRGKSFDLATGPVTLIIGQNTAGKTTIADAIKWGMLGYIPGMSV